MELRHDLVAITLPRSEWIALIIAASIVDTLNRHPNIVIAEPGTDLRLLDTARASLALQLRDEPPVDSQLQKNIARRLDAGGARKTRRRPMSQKNRKAVSTRMRKYWADKRRRAKGGAK